MKLPKLDAELTAWPNVLLLVVGVSKFRLFGVWALEEHCDDGVISRGFTGEGVAMDGLGVAMEDVGVCIVVFSGGGLGTGGDIAGGKTAKLAFFFSASYLSF